MDWFLHDRDFRHERVNYHSNLINPFHATGFFLHAVKTSENLQFLMFSGGIETDH